VHRLAEFEHEVVGDVDRERDRAHAAQGQAPLHPLRTRRRRVIAGDEAAGEAVASVWVLDRERVRRLGRQARHLDVGRVAERHTERVRQLAGDATHREAVAPVGRDVEFDHHLVQPDDRTRVGTRLTIHIGG
jgi:hypothetical protein